MSRNTVAPSTETNCLSQKLECVICFSLATNPSKCPYCSAIVCAKCIEVSITNQYSCPKCLHVVEKKNLVKCHFGNEVVDFIDKSMTNCSKHPKETLIIHCLTCKKYVCSQCIAADNEHRNHEYKQIDQKFEEILTHNHKILDFIRRRRQIYCDQLKILELDIRTLTTTRNPSQAKTTAESSLLNPEHTSLDNCLKKRQCYNDTITNDELIIRDIEKRLAESKNLSDLEEILRILQKYIPSKSSNQ